MKFVTHWFWACAALVLVSAWLPLVHTLIWIYGKRVLPQCVIAVVIPPMRVLATATETAFAKERECRRG